MSCEYCEKGIDLDDGGMDGSGVTIQYYENKGYITKNANCECGGAIDIPINFCPMCGQYLGENKPLTVEELKQMDGKVIYTKTIGVKGSVRMEFICFASDRVHLKTACENYSMTYSELENTYRESWLAYRYKPKEINT